MFKFSKEQMKTALLTTLMIGGLVGLTYGGKEGYNRFVKPRFAKPAVPPPVK